jgi:hypothetical protein
MATENRVLLLDVWVGVRDTTGTGNAVGKDAAVEMAVEFPLG